MLSGFPAVSKAAESSKKANAVQWLIQAAEEENEWRDGGLPNPTCDVMAVLRGEGESCESGYLDWWETENYDREFNVDELAHLTWTRQEQEYLDFIRENQNEDGGYGLMERYTSDVYDTLLVLYAELSVNGGLVSEKTQNTNMESRNEKWIQSVAEYHWKEQLADGGFVPTALSMAIQITIQVENTDDKPINATIRALEKSIPLLLGNMDFPSTNFWAKSITKVSTTINTTNIKKYSNQIRHFSHQWKWFYERDSLDAYDLAETTEELYVIPDIPSHLWNTNAQQYSLYEPNYIWTSLLDICCKACEEYSQVLGLLPGTVEEHVAAFAYGLNHKNRIQFH